MWALFTIMYIICTQFYLLFRWNFGHFLEFRSLALCPPCPVKVGRAQPVSTSISNTVVQDIHRAFEVDEPSEVKIDAPSKDVAQPSHLHPRPAPGLGIYLNIRDFRIRGTGSIPQQDKALPGRTGANTDRAIGLLFGVFFDLWCLI